MCDSLPCDCRRSRIPEKLPNMTKLPATGVALHQFYFRWLVYNYRHTAKNHRSLSEELVMSCFVEQGPQPIRDALSYRHLMRRIAGEGEHSMEPLYGKIEGLVAKKLIRSKPDPECRRMNIAHLTASGRRRLEGQIRSLAAFVAELAGGGGEEFTSFLSTMVCSPPSPQSPPRFRIQMPLEHKPGQLVKVLDCLTTFNIEDIDIGPIDASNCASVRIWLDSGTDLESLRQSLTEKLKHVSMGIEIKQGE